MVTRTDQDPVPELTVDRLCCVPRTMVGEQYVVQPCIIDGSGATLESSGF
jgi:hypothetical protein